MSSFDLNYKSFLSLAKKIFISKRFSFLNLKNPFFLLLQTLGAWFHKSSCTDCADGIGKPYIINFKIFRAFICRNFFGDFFSTTFSCRERNKLRCCQIKAMIWSLSVVYLSDDKKNYNLNLILKQELYFVGEKIFALKVLLNFNIGK